MSETKIILKKWLPVSISHELSPSLLDKLILVCSNSMELRSCKTKDGNPGLELLCENSKEFLEAEAIIHQALADERLREEIVAKSDIKVTEMVESLLLKALGQQ